MNVPWFKSFFLLLFLAASSFLFSQNIGINTSGTAPSTNAILDLNSGNNYNVGVIIPHVELGASLSTFNPPIANGATVKDTGMMIYNVSALYQPIGYYYWNGNTWVNVTNGGIGTTNYIVKWTPNGATLGNSLVYDNGTSVGIGTNAPNAGAALDITSNTQGILIPRLAVNPASPALGMMYFNTTTNCLMVYSGVTWQNIYCTCSAAPATPGVITGSAAVCSGVSGVIYSISAVAGATSYTWYVPPGATITAGLSSTSITVTFGTTSGNVSVTANNSCGTSAASNLAVTVNSAPAITVQPTSPATVCYGNGTANFTVTATGAGLTYQWQEYIVSWNNIANGGVYSGATTATLTITNPPLAMNGRFYRCIVSGTCAPSITTNGLALLTVHVPSIPITLTNNQVSATSANFQQMLTINSSTYSANESAGLQNVEFSTGPGATGTILQAWIESGATNASVNTIYWVNLGASTVPANGTLTIYMNFMSANIMSGAGPTGEAPQLSAPYAQNDNGSLVFTTLYNNFSGVAISGAYTQIAPGGCTITQNNGVTITTNAIAQYGGLIYTAGYASSPTQVFDGDVTAVSGVAAGFGLQNGNTSNSGSIDFNFWGGSVATGVMNAPGMVNNNNPNLQLSTGIMGGAWVTASSQVWYKNYVSTAGSQNAYALPVTIYPAIGIYYLSVSSSITYQWIRTHLYAPNGVMPTTTLVSVGCY